MHLKIPAFWEVVLIRVDRIKKHREKWERQERPYLLFQHSDINPTHCLYRESLLILMEYQGWLVRWGNGRNGFWNIDIVFSSASCAETQHCYFLLAYLKCILWSSKVKNIWETLLCFSYWYLHPWEHIIMLGNCLPFSYFFSNPDCCANCYVSFP